MSYKILGFDVSSSCIGFAILDVESNLTSILETGYFKPILKNGDIFDNLSIIKDNVFNLILKHKPNSIAIEDYIKYMKGKSSANTITKLATYNRYLGMCCFEYMKKKPFLYNVLSIRCAIKKILNLPNIPKKEELPELLEKILNFDFPWILKNNKKIKNNYDVSDAIACSFFHLYKENYGNFKS